MVPLAVHMYGPCKWWRQITYTSVHTFRTYPVLGSKLLPWTARRRHSVANLKDVSFRHQFAGGKAIARCALMIWLRKACIIGLRLPLGGRRSRVAKGASGMFSCQSSEWAKTPQATWKRIRFDPTKILKSGPATMEASSSTFSISMTKIQ